MLVERDHNSMLITDTDTESGKEGPGAPRQSPGVPNNGIISTACGRPAETRRHQTRQKVEDINTGQQLQSTVVVRISLTPVDFTSHAEMDQGVVLLSFTHLGSFRQKKSSRTTSKPHTRNILQLKSLATLFNKLLPTRKQKTEKVASPKVFYSPKVEAEKYNFEAEIERFQRDFILPLEKWEAATSETSSEPSGKFSSASTSDFDSGHFSGDLMESGCFSSSVSTISSLSDRKATSVLECRSDHDNDDDDNDNDDDDDSNEVI